MDKIVQDRLNEWLKDEYDQATRDELQALVDAKDDEEITERFYKELDFGTGGLRGIMGAGTNRMNIYVVRKATQGLASYMLENGGADVKTRGAVVAFDARKNSDLFAKEVALTLAANGIKAYLFDKLCPTPELSFAVRHLNAVAGVNITASHNPPEYNGYKAYWEDGAQMTPPHDKGVIAEVRKVATLKDCKSIGEKEAREKGLLISIGEDVDEAYFEKIEKLALSRDLIEDVGDEVKVVYTPLHGAGCYCVPEMLKRFGFQNILVVPEQAEPNGEFPTIDAPNPEVQSSMQLALDLAKREKADLVLGTDADSDRLGMAVPDSKGEFKLLTGNQIGCVLIDYYLRRLKENDKLPANGVVVKTIVTTELQRDLAKANGVECIDVLTGFKWIGRKMLEWEQKRAAGQETKEYLVGGEESYGFLAGDFVRDKDAVIAACLLAEAAVECRSKGKSLFDRLDEIYLEHGLYVDELRNVFHEGKEGAEKIVAIMKTLRENPQTKIGGYEIVERWDVENGQVYHSDGSMSGPLDLPASNVLVYKLDNGCTVTARPSGTEPKIKFYFSLKVPKPEDKNGQEALVDMRKGAKTLAIEVVDDFMSMVNDI